MFLLAQYTNTTLDKFTVNGKLSILAGILFCIFLISISYHNNSTKANLYLADKASIYVENIESFETKVRDVAARLDVPPEWLMAVMFSESRFDAKATNFKGSGAVGLIQFMPPTAVELGTSCWKIKDMTHEEQLEYVYQYMDSKKKQYGSYQSLTDFYLGILYPKAIGQEPCYVMYSKPSKMYKQNVGLDVNKDGHVTISDIDKRMQSLYPHAYIASKN